MCSCKNQSIDIYLLFTIIINRLNIEIFVKDKINTEWTFNLGLIL